MTEAYGFDRSGMQRAVRAIRRVEGMPLADQTPQKRHVRVIESYMRIGIAQEAISPNTSGTFQFAYGTKGSETADGNDLEGYYRTASDSADIPEDAVCYVFWINGGWELTPVECP